MRQSNIELLRIISMILIIMHHFSVHGTFPFTPDLTFNKVFLQVFALGGKAGVVAFVMITGYFMISSSFKLHKFAKLIGQIWFYSIAMLGVAMGLGLDTVTSRNMMLALLPIGAIGFVGAFLGDILVDVLAITNPEYMKQIFYFTKNDYGLFQLLLGIGLFILFLKAKIVYRPWINTVASTTFGIYLLHDNRLFLHHMWDNILATYQYYDLILFPLYATLIVALIFVIGMTVDYVRLAFIEKSVMKVITPSLERI